MSRNPLIPCKMARMQNGHGDDISLALYDDALAVLNALILDIDNSTDDHCLVAWLRKMNEEQTKLDPLDVLETVNKIQNRLNDVFAKFVSARSKSRS